jgi:DNA-binding MarR family transcriptional regulator
VATDNDDYVHVAAFRSALRQLLRQTETVARNAGLTPQRYLLLLMIKGAPDGSGTSTVTELSDRLHLAQSTVTELVGRAENAGLVRRRPSQDDARVAHVCLTEEGERRLEQAFTTLEGERESVREAFLGL